MISQASLALRACSDCSGDYEDPERTAVIGDEDLEDHGESVESSAGEAEKHRPHAPPSPRHKFLLPKTEEGRGNDEAGNDATNKK